MYYELTDDSTKIMQPEHLTINLFDHQKAAVRAMSELEDKKKIKIDIDSEIYLNINETIERYLKYKDHYTSSDIDSIELNTSMGILGDRVGTGKSVILMGLISSKPRLLNNNYIHSGKFYLSFEVNHRENIGHNLLIIPDKLYKQWMENMDMINNVSVYGCNNKKSIEELKIREYDVIILVSSKYKEFMDIHGNIKWGRVMVDEADTIKLRGNTLFNSTFVWFITNSIDLLLNCTSFKHIFKQYTYKFIRNIVVKNSTEFINKSIVLPNIYKNKILCTTPTELASDDISNKIVEILDAEGIDKTVELINCNMNKKSKTINILTNNITKKIKKIDEINMKNNSPRYHEIKYKLSEEKRVLESKIKTITDNISSIDETSCPICYESLLYPTIVSCCNNVFCFKCILKSANCNIDETRVSRCPICREEINKKNIYVMNEKNKKNNLLKSKLDSMMNIINSNDNKIVIWDNWYSCESIMNALSNAKINFSTLKGKKELNKQLNNFIEGDSRVLVLNHDTLILGLNLFVANTLIFYNKVPSAIEDKVIGTVHRYGRTSPLNIHYLCCSEEY